MFKITEEVERIEKEVFVCSVPPTGCSFLTCTGSPDLSSFHSLCCFSGFVHIGEKGVMYPIKNVNV